MKFEKVTGWAQIVLAILMGITSFNFIMEAGIINNDYLPYNMGLLIFFLGILVAVAVLLQGIVNILDKRD